MLLVYGRKFTRYDYYNMDFIIDKNDEKKVLSNFYNRKKMYLQDDKILDENGNLITTIIIL